MSKFQDIAAIISNNEGLKFGKFVGKGAFKETYESFDAKGNKIAVKVFDPQKCNIERAGREIEAMMRCESDRIGKIFKYSSVCIDGNTVHYSLEEFLDGGSLESVIQGVAASKRLLQIILQHIGEALVCTKSHNLVHRDIKPANIMLRGNGRDLVLVDFGLVRDLTKDSLTMSWVQMGPGTPLFMAPEQLLNEKSLISWKTDQFSLGILSALYLTKAHPFSLAGDTGPECIERVANHVGPSPWFIEYANNNSLQAITKMIEPWPIRRFNNPQDIVNFAKEINI